MYSETSHRSLKPDILVEPGAVLPYRRSITAPARIQLTCTGFHITAEHFPGAHTWLWALFSSNTSPARILPLCQLANNWQDAPSDQIFSYFNLTGLPPSCPTAAQSKYTGCSVEECIVSNVRQSAILCRQFYIWKHSFGQNQKLFAF